MASIDEFISYAQGKVFNNQGNVMNINYVQTSYPYGGQCVSLAQGFMKYFGCEVKARGNAVDWWRNFNSNGLSAYFTKSGSPINGALCITNADPTFGHIGVYYNGKMLQQNYAGSPYARLLPITGTVWGYLIPKFSISSNYSDSQLINEHAYATLKYDVQKRRDTPNGMAVETLKTGRKLEYTQKWVGNGHRYISWVEHQADGASYRYFVAVNGNEAGTEPWADFTAIEEQKPAESITLTQEDGIATFTVDAVRARYDSPTGTVCRTYNSGDTIRYYWKWVGNGHRYVVGKDGDKKVFVAVSATEDRSEMWATFAAPEEDKKEETKPTDKKDETTTKPDDKKEDTKEDTTPVKPDYNKLAKGFGVDISEHNGANFDVSKYDFVIIRACYGENTDKLFETYVKKCEDAKIPYGVYCYDYALDDSQAKAEAEYILNLIKGKNIQLGVWFDMEDADHYKQKKGVLTKERCTSSCKIFCDILKAKGYYTGVYTSTSWLGTFVDTEYPLWIANWGTNDGTIQSDQSNVGVMHQYSANPIDKDIIFHDVDFYKSNPVEDKEPEKPVEPEKPTEPEQPSEPEKPSEPEPTPDPEPSEPEKPAEPETPEEDTKKSLADAIVNLVKAIIDAIVNLFKKKK